MSWGSHFQSIPPAIGYFILLQLSPFPFDRRVLTENRYAWARKIEGSSWAMKR